MKFDKSANKMNEKKSLDIQEWDDANGKGCKLVKVLCNVVGNKWMNQWTEQRKWIRLKNCSCVTISYWI